MINQTPNNLDKFPEPVAGSVIPRGWFGRLVRFINSLILHGDGQFLTVKHTMDGQTIAPTPALLQALGQSGAPPSAGGGSNHPYVPNYGSPTAISPNTQYGPLAYPVWLIGSIGAVLYGSTIYEAYLTLGSTSTSIPLFDVTQSSGSEGAQITQLVIPVSILIPASTSFTVYTSTTNPSNFDINLKYYPLI